MPVTGDPALLNMVRSLVVRSEILLIVPAETKSNRATRGVCTVMDSLFRRNHMARKIKQKSRQHSAVVIPIFSTDENGIEATFPVMVFVSHVVLTRINAMAFETNVTGKVIRVSAPATMTTVARGTIRIFVSIKNAGNLLNRVIVRARVPA